MKRKILTFVMMTALCSMLSGCGEETKEEKIREEKAKILEESLNDYCSVNGWIAGYDCEGKLIWGHKVGSGKHDCVPDETAQIIFEVLTKD